VHTNAMTTLRDRVAYFRGILESHPDIDRIVDNAHLLDATEIFRKLNVHKKVSLTPFHMEIKHF
jgi:hypothetical protein